MIADGAATCNGLHIRILNMGARQLATNITSKRVDEFLSALKDAGGSCGNGSLRKKLGWDEDFYWRIQGDLIGKGRIVAGRGKGGSVRLSENELTESNYINPSPNGTIDQSSDIKTERGLYPILMQSIESRWIQRFALDDVLVSETHSRGSKDTNGTFTRPDITAVGVRRYVYLPKRLEVITFEIKHEKSIDIRGVLEAIAHREAAHRTYVVFAASRKKFESATESDRIIELCQKYGIGLLLTERPDAVETWEILLDSTRNEPDPARLDRFLIDLPSENMRKQIAKWNG